MGCPKSYILCSILCSSREMHDIRRNTHSVQDRKGVWLPTNTALCSSHPCVWPRNGCCPQGAVPVIYGSPTVNKVDAFRNLKQCLRSDFSQRIDSKPQQFKSCFRCGGKNAQRACALKAENVSSNSSHRTHTVFSLAIILHQYVHAAGKPRNPEERSTGHPLAKTLSARYHSPSPIPWG